MSVDAFDTAQSMLCALARSEISSTELTELHIARVEELDGELNAIPVRTFERAREEARRVDGVDPSERGALGGLPMTLKESTLVAGLPQSAGLPAFAELRPSVDGAVARSVFDAGACLLGKTNIPIALSDWQADSPVYGRTHNPWDRSRTPGGSTGGGGAALAAGLTPLEVGSDIGGSIRIPASYCGVYGHRPSETAVPRSGAFPMADAPNPVTLMGVQGPLARSAGDLEVLFDVLRGPEVGEDVAWRLELPEARASRLEHFRVAVMPLPMAVRPSAAVTERFEELLDFLRGLGATVGEAAPQIDLDAYFLDYCCLLNAMISLGEPEERRRSRAQDLRATGDPVNEALADGLELEFPDLVRVTTRREVARSAWRQFFGDWDVVVAPMTLDVAFEHQEARFAERTLSIDGAELRYFFNLVPAMIAIFPGLPSTAFPAGLSTADLPIGMQAIGPYLEDRTTLRFARLLEESWHSFERPPGF